MEGLEWDVTSAGLETTPSLRVSKAFWVVVLAMTLEPGIMFPRPRITWETG